MLEIKLLNDLAFGGFLEYAISLANGVVESGGENTEDRFHAALTLSKVAALKEDLEEALVRMNEAVRLAPMQAASVRVILYRALLLARAGRVMEARIVLQDGIEQIGSDGRLLYAMSGVVSDMSERLVWINRSLQGFAPVKLRNDLEPLSIHNLRADVVPVENGPRISVIMPTFNSSGTVEMAARSILEQSWRNIELIIVDDASTDHTWSIIQQFAASDSRVVPVRRSANGGAYAARNDGLSVYSGEYVTVNDGDDWSHPQRLEIQIQDIISGKYKFNTTFGVRASEALFPAPKARSGEFMVENTSSLLVSRADMDRLGQWDLVRFSADSELYERLCSLHNAKPRYLHKRTPLAFILSRADSLTGTSSATGLGSLLFGARRAYKDLSRRWHEQGGRKHNTGRRAFPVPRIALRASSEPIHLGALLISDLSLKLPELSDLATPLGVLHLPHPLRLRMPLLPSILDKVLAGEVQMIVSGESVKCETVLIDGPIVALPDNWPEIDCHQCILRGITENDLEQTSRNAMILSRTENVIIEKLVPSRIGLANRNESLAKILNEISRARPLNAESA